jgi:hypothetical protein
MTYLLGGDRPLAAQGANYQEGIGVLLLLLRESRHKASDTNIWRLAAEQHSHFIRAL